MDLVTQFGSAVQDNLASVGSFRPELALTFGTLLLFLVDAIWRKSGARRAITTVAALAVLGVTAVLLATQPVAASRLFNGMVANDLFGTFFKWLFLGAGVLTVTIAARGTDFPSPRVGQFYALLTAVILGMFLMSSASDLLMMYMAIELVSMVSYTLAGYKKGDRRAAEASLKYVIYGGVASGVMLFGMSYLYGLTRTTDIYKIAAAVQQLGAGGLTPAYKITLVLAVVFVTAGIGYKVAAVPWHMWCPDVYEGAPTVFTAFLSVGPKAAGFALAIRFFYTAFATPAGAGGLAATIAGVPWTAVVGVIAAVTMTLGNLTALSQTNLKRLLAYSSIAHAGYTLMGVSALSEMGKQSVMLYMLIYLVMNVGAFLVVIVVAEATGSESILDYRGMARRHPFAALALSIFLFSLTGIPPFAGFVGKWYLFYALIERIPGPGGFWYGVLMVIAALNTAVSLFYYVRVVRAMYIDQPHAEPTPIKVPLFYQVVLAGCSIAVLLFGVWWGPMVDWTRASLQMFGG
ncbi:MAG TPA: NADH-quinone oxidoreductase subunit N [Anaeromyxobacteraceae bacterium]|nr:NADH-quinone oxidoreductase subunit N [Anaeromyxobacteraceae bacterium]